MSESNSILVKKKIRKSRRRDITSGDNAAKTTDILDAFIPTKRVTERVYDGMSRGIDDILYKAETLRVKIQGVEPPVFTCVCGVKVDIYKYRVHDGNIISSSAAHHVQYHRKEMSLTHKIWLNLCINRMPSSTHDRLRTEELKTGRWGKGEDSRLVSINCTRDPREVDVHILCGFCGEIGVREFKNKGIEEAFIDFDRGEYGKKTRFEVDDGKTCNWCGKDF